MGPERLLSAAEYQALELIESHLERDDGRLADRLAHAFEARSPGVRLAAWCRPRWEGLTLVAAVILVSAAAVPAGGTAFGVAVAALATMGAGLIAGTTWAYHRVVLPFLASRR